MLRTIGWETFSKLWTTTRVKWYTEGALDDRRASYGDATDSLSFLWLVNRNRITDRFTHPMKMCFIFSLPPSLDYMLKWVISMDIAIVPWHPTFARPSNSPGG